MNIPIAKRIKGAVGHAAATAGLFARAFRSKMIIMAFHRINDDMPEDGVTGDSPCIAEVERGATAPA